MARGTSVIDVLIVGDVKKLVGAFNQVDASTGGLVKSLGKTFLASKVVGEAFDFLQSSLGEADRLGDAMARLNGQIGETNAAKLEATASAFSDLGQSKQDVLELEAAFADAGTTLGITDQTLQEFAPSAVTAAASLALLRDESPAEIMDLIAKAMGGSEKAAKALGVEVDKNLPVQGQFLSIMQQLQPQLDQVAGSGKDVEQQQAKLGAQFETLQANVGQLVEGPLTDLLGFINDEIEALPHAIEGFQMLGRAVVGAFENALSPIARFNDALGDVGDALRGIPFLGDVVGALFGGGGSGLNDRQLLDAVNREQRRNSGPQGRD